MKESADPGHSYFVDVYDGVINNKKILPIIFMKRVGEGYPGNEGEPHPGTNCQEVIRVLIDRMKYLQNQIPCQHNLIVMQKLRECLWLFEDRAAERHGFASHDIDFRPENIEEENYCTTCGHIMCKGHP